MSLLTVDLDNMPESFERAVPIPDAVSGGVLKVRFTFTWRDAIEGAQLFDRLLAEARQLLAEARAKEEPDGAADAQAVIARHIHVLRTMATAWNIDAPFDEEHLTKFFRRYPAASQAITDSYRAAVMLGQ